MPETAQQYISRILGNLGGHNPLKVQASTPQRLERMVKRVPLAKLRKRPAPEKWSVGEILAHLADGEIVASWRMRLILGAPGTPIQAFEPFIKGNIETVIVWAPVALLWILGGTIFATVRWIKRGFTS